MIRSLISFFLSLWFPTLLNIPKVSKELAEKREHRFLGALNLSSTEFWNTDITYRKAKIPKKTGGYRELNIPTDELKDLQWKILTLLDRNHAQKVHGCANGFVKGRGIISNARPHLNCALLIKLDIKDFFPSIAKFKIEPWLRFKWMPLKGHSEDPDRITNRLLDILCLEEGLPQGAPSSPLLSNLVLRNLDMALSSYVNKYGGAYTRYADDITISYAKDEPGVVRKTIQTVEKALFDRGFQLNRKRQKLRVLRRHQAQNICGITINSGRMTLSRKKRRQLRAIEHHLKQGKDATLKVEQLAGWEAYSSMIRNS